MQKTLALLAPFLGLALSLVLWCPRAAGAPPARKLSNAEAAHHVLSRLAFGARPGQFSEVARVGWKDWAEAQLHPETIGDARLEERLARECPSLGYSLAELEGLSRGQDQRAKREARERIKDELRTSVLLRGVYSE